VLKKVDVHKNGVILAIENNWATRENRLQGILTRRNLGLLSADEFFNSHSPSHSPKTPGTPQNPIFRITGNTEVSWNRTARKVVPAQPVDATHVPFCSRPIRFW
jgi:hypothetical protein